ncbi:MAG TPA: ABC transporter ATP-binding protein [Pirellulales bacterium]|nr:ABC transporter ATP-binding protein [Pirellulales bacterium]
MNSQPTTTGNHSPRGELLRTERLEKIYPDGDVHALVDVSLSVARGEYVAVMGKSGSGKSTLLNLLGALDRPTSGEVYFEGQPLSRARRLDRLRAEKIGFVFQSFHLLPMLTALENVQIPLFEGPLSAAQRQEKAARQLAEVGMSHRADHLPNQLSVGERQRIAIARALVNDPLLLLADEPTGNLDSRTGREILDLFDRLHRERSLTLIVISHSLDVAERAERVLHVRDGRVEAGEPRGEGDDG